MKLGTKIQLFTTLWMVMLLVLINTGIYALFYHSAMSLELTRLQDKTESMVKAVKGELATPGGATRLLRAYIPEEGMIRVVDQRNRAVLTVTENPNLTRIKPKYENQESHRRIHVDQRPYLSVVYPMVWENGDVTDMEVTQSLEGIYANLKMLRWVLGVAGLAVLVPTLMGGRMLTRLILRPIHSLTQTMEMNQRQGSYQHLETGRRSKDELYWMAVTFNRMMDILKTHYEKQQQFVSDASHELKTPLTVIESYAKLLKRWGMKRPEILKEAVDSIHSEAVRMKEMTRQMLELATEEHHEVLEIEETELVSFCEASLKPLRKTYQRDIELKSDRETVYAEVDQQKIKQLLFILLDNALKYSEGLVTVHVGKKRENPFLSVTDRGVGIPAEEQERIFERFYRVDKARSRDTGGTGLGLSVAKKIVKAHGAEIDVESKENQGTTVTVSFRKGVPLQEGRDE